MKSIAAPMFLSGALLATPSASSLYAGDFGGLLEDKIAGGDEDHGVSNRIKDSDDPFYDDSGSGDRIGDADGTGDYPERSSLFF